MKNEPSIHTRRARIKHLGEQLKLRQLSQEDTDFLSEALIKIGDGKEDPATALDIKGRRGVRNGERARISEERKELANLTIFLARQGYSVTPEEEQSYMVKGAKLSLEYVVGKYGESDWNLFHLTEETLKTFYAETPLSKEDIQIILKWIGSLEAP